MKIIYYDRINVSEGIDVNKTSASKEWRICHYWYILNWSFRFQPVVCNRCHILLMMSINLSNIAILKIIGPDYCSFISLISRNKAINFCKTLIWLRKVEQYELKNIKFFGSIYKNGKNYKIWDIEIQKQKFHQYK